MGYEHWTLQQEDVLKEFYPKYGYKIFFAEMQKLEPNFLKTAKMTNAKWRNSFGGKVNRPVIKRDPQDNTMSRNWTRTTIDCYERAFRCSGCSVEQYCEKDSMKNTVLESFRKHGQPTI